MGALKRVIGCGDFCGVARSSAICFFFFFPDTTFDLSLTNVLNWWTPFAAFFSQIVSCSIFCAFHMPFTPATFVETSSHRCLFLVLLVTYIFFKTAKAKIAFLSATLVTSADRGWGVSPIREARDPHLVSGRS